MKVKIDTKEKFDVLTLQDTILSANMTEELNQLLLSFLKKNNKNVVLKMGTINEIDDVVANSLLSIQQKFYSENASFVICEIGPSLEQYLKNLKIFQMMNITPTESEAWDIVQMEEIERELME
jgi:anti-anti-sigma regulatory factor